MFQKLIKRLWQILNPQDLEGIIKLNIDKNAWRYATIILIASVTIMPMWAALDYFYARDNWFNLFLLRISLSVFFLGVYFWSKSFRKSSNLLVHICFTGISFQAAFLVNIVDLDVLKYYFLAFSALFFAVNMLVIWKPINSVIQQFVALFLFLGFYAFYQKFNFAELISNGGLTLFTISTLSTLLVRTRYNFERQEIKARALINISNEQLQLQNKMIKQQKEEIEKKNTNIIEQNDALRIAKLSAEDASRSKADFLATMSHEIRTPLNGVIGLTHLLLDENPRPEQLEHLNALNFSAENLLTVVNDVLDYSKIEKGKIEFEEIDFSLKDVTKAIVRSLDYKAKEKGIQLVLKNDENLPEKINGDPTRLGQVLNNLLNNAIKFTDTGLVNLITKVVKSGDDKVDILFMVEDTGIGIPKDKQRLIFDRFTQSSSSTTRKYGGTGLGLSICKNLLSLKGVSLNLESEMGKGSKFFFTMDFKAVKVAKANKEQVIVKDELAELKGFRVLVAEDNLLNQKIIAKFLKKWGMEYEVVENGMDAVQQVKKGGFDLVLMDLQMPEMDGLEATKMIRTLADEKQSDIPIIALTASAMLSVKADVKEAGMDDYISKPFNPTDLYRKISHCIDKIATNDLGKKIILN